MQQLTNTINYIQGNRRKHNSKPHLEKTQRLIDDLSCTYDRAFQPEYTGGFDVVFGNPPYVDIRGMNKRIV